VPDLATLRALDLPAFLEAHQGLTPAPTSRAGNPLYRCPFHEDKRASLSVFQGRGGWRWKCHACDVGGTILDFVMRAEGVELAEAAATVARAAGIEWRPKSNGGPPRPRTEAEEKLDWLAKKVTHHHQVNEAASYLVDERRIDRKVVDKLLQEKRIGFSDYKGVQGCAFTILSWPAAELVAVDVRRWNSPDPKDTQRHHGHNEGHFWWHDRARLNKARTVWIAESTIDALSLETAGKTAIAVRTWANHDRDWSWLEGRQVFLCLDGDDRGQEGTRRLYKRLLAAGARPRVVGLGWQDDRKVDPNGVLQQGGAEFLRGKLKEATLDAPVWDPARVARMPSHLRAANGGEKGLRDRGDHVTAYLFRDSQWQRTPVCDFSLRSVESVEFLDYATGTPQRRLYRFQYVQADTAALRSVMVEDHRFGDPAAFAKCGLIHDLSRFKLYLSLVHFNRNESRPMKNVVGLIDVKGTPTLCDASNMDFLKGDNECVYAGMRFPSGSIEEGRKVWDDLCAMWTSGQGELVTTWLLGSFLKVWTGFWPHMKGAAPKGTGKTTFLAVLADAFRLKSISGEEIRTNYRRKVLVSNSLFPLAMDEISRYATRKQSTEFFHLMNAAYMHASTNHNIQGVRIHYEILTPFLFFGQDEGTEDTAFASKCLNVALHPRDKGALPQIAAPFPLREWGLWLAAKRPDVEREIAEATVALREQVKVPVASSDSDRLLKNGAVMVVARGLVGEFLDRPDGGAFFELIARSLNDQMADVAGVSAKESVEPLYLFAATYATDPNPGISAEVRWVEGHGACLVVSAQHLLVYLERNRRTCAIRTPKTLIARLEDDGLLIAHQRIRVGTKQIRAVVISIKELQKHGVDFPVPEEPRPLMLQP